MARRTHDSRSAILFAALLSILGEACGAGTASVRSDSADVQHVSVPVVSVAAEATLSEMLSAMAAADWGQPGEDCYFVWGNVRADPRLAALRVVAEDIELSGYAGCEDEAIDAVLPPPSGVIVGFRGESLVLGHGSDMSESVELDEAYAEVARGDPRIGASYTMIAIAGDEQVAAATALAAFVRLTEVFGSALLPLGPHVIRR